MPRQSKLSEEECKQRLADAIEEEVDVKLEKFQQTVCGPRVLLTNQIGDSIKELKEGQEHIIKRLDSVSANGNKGLEASLRDLYNKGSETHIAVMELRTTVDGMIVVEKNKWFNKSLKEIFTAKNTFTKIFWYVFIFMAATVILHAFGIDVNQVLDVFKTIKSGV